MSAGPGEPRPEERLAESAEKVVSAVGRFAAWAARTGTDVARRLPGAAAVEAEVGHLERAVLGGLRRRLDTVDPHPADPRAADPRGGDPLVGDPLTSGPLAADLGPAHQGPAVLRSAGPSTVDRAAGPSAAGADRRAGTPAPPPEPGEQLRAVMARLLVRSIDQTRQEAAEHLHLAVLRQLLPDEARILAALADGSAYPLVHVEYRTGVATTHRVLANASTVGRAAGVGAFAAVPRYLGRLAHLDLVSVGPPDPELSVQYEICMTYEEVRAAEAQARALGRVRMVKESVTISAFGAELWEACRPRDEELASPAVPAQRPAAPGERTTTGSDPLR